MKIKLKLRDGKIINFDNVKEGWIENSFLIIGHDEGKGKRKLEPIELENIDYWVEIKEKKK